MSVDDGPMARVFFALWPPVEVADAIAERMAAIPVDGRRVAGERLHLTLAYHGVSNAAGVAELERRADELRISAFDLVLDRIGCFRRAGVVWLGPDAPPAPLARLADALAPSDGNRQATVFRPHVTIARKATPVAPAPVAPIHWPVRFFALVASGRDGAPDSYRELAQWPLCAGSAGMK